MKLSRLFHRYRRRRLGRRKQTRLWKRTHKEGNRKKRAEHGRAMRKLRGLIKGLIRVRPISAAGLRFIMRHEGFLPTPYNDPVGFATIAIGHLIRHGPVQPSDHQSVWVKGQRTPGRVTTGEGLRLLRQDVRQDFEPAVRALFEKGGPLHGKFRQHRIDALISYAYNLGAGAVQGAAGFETMGRALESGDIRSIGDAMLLYDKAGGTALPGLTRRRQEERRLFLRGQYN